MASNINPNNIDGSYPVAGQDNSSQGFRDNFTNIRQNFQFAENEVNDLQSKVVLKAALTGSTLDNNMNDNLLYAAAIRDFSAPRVTVTPASGTATINYSAGHYQTISTTGAVTLAFGTDWPAAGNYGLVKVQINITNVAHTVTLPAAVSLGTSGLQGYNAGTRTITFGVTGFYEFAFGSYDAGTTITIFDLSRGLVNFAFADITVNDLTAAGTVAATGNVTGGNLITAGFTQATGNVVGGNVTTAGLISAAGNVTSAGNVAGGNVLATNSVQGGNLIGLLRPTAGTTTVAPLQFTSGGPITLPAGVSGGTIEYNGVILQAAHTAQQRGILPVSMYRIQDGARTLTRGTSAINVFSSEPSISLAAGTYYEFEAIYYITRAAGAVSRTWSVLFSLGGTLSSITYMAETTSTASNILGTVSRVRGTAATATVVTAASTATDENVTIHLRGIIKINAAGSVTPQVQCSADAGADASLLSNSYIKFVPLGTAAAVGFWS
jgi:hypothetical protein